MKENIIQQKSFAFAGKLVNFFNENDLGKVEPLFLVQLLDKGASVGLIVDESYEFKGGKHFISKMEEAYSETRKLLFWLRLLEATSEVNPAAGKSLTADVEELLRLLGSIKSSYKKNRSKKAGENQEKVA